MANNIKGEPQHKCSLEHYDRYRLRGPSGAIIAVGSYADIERITTGTIVNEKVLAYPLFGEVEFFAKATR